MIKTAYIGIGSNLGDKPANCRKAIEMIDRIPECRLTARADLYQTAPVGVKGHDWYVNTAVSVDTGLAAVELLTALLDIETSLGRVRRYKWDPRTVDLDILLFGSDVVREKHLTIPHLLMHKRKFVLVPMAQLASNLPHPVLGRSMADLLGAISHEAQCVTRLKEV